MHKTHSSKQHVRTEFLDPRHTILGYGEEKGVIPLSINQIFKLIAQQPGAFLAPNHAITNHPNHHNPRRAQGITEPECPL